MPIYVFECIDCRNEVEKIQAIGNESPACPQCGGVMCKKPSPIAMFKMKDDSGYNVRSKGYKEGYKKEYLKSKGQEVWRDTIVSP